MAMYDLEQEYAEPTENVTKHHLTIGDLSRLTGAPIKAIRYYEQVGVLPPASRKANGYRYYIQADVRRVHLLRRLRFLGASLSEARPLLVATTNSQCREVQKDLLRLVESRLVELDREIAELITLREHVRLDQQWLTRSPLGHEEDFATCCGGSCLACCRLPHENELNAVQWRKSQGFYDE